MSSRRGSFLSIKLHCSSCLPCPLYFEKFKPSEKLQEHGTECPDARHLEAKGSSSLYCGLSLRGSCIGQRDAVQQTDHCGHFGVDFPTVRHAKRTTINTEDVKLLARRSNSLLKYITDKSEEIAQINLERKAQKKKKSEDGSKNSRQPAEAGVVESEN
ncbi:centromere protein S isoform X1 [Hylobates moloch]|uniref:centromere protein S isoform X1 n=1 Tax=Hylobates moloch TaxID=81572 RepID=UPI002675AFCD|nr:centromere protein S isoform X1 [Hylobates moloch]